MAKFPSRIINRCPAIMFAVNRTARDVGRIILLTVSIHTMNGISIIGVFIGKVWVNILFVKLIHP